MKREEGHLGDGGMLRAMRAWASGGEDFAVQQGMAKLMMPDCERAWE